MIIALVSTFAIKSDMLYSSKMTGIIIFCSGLVFMLPNNCQIRSTLPQPCRHSDPDRPPRAIRNRRLDVYGGAKGGGQETRTKMCRGLVRDQSKVL